MDIKKAAQKIFDKTYCNFDMGGAYSAKAYTKKGWLKACEKLLERGFTPKQVKDLLCSKATRWAADGSDKAYGRNTEVEILNFVDKNDLSEFIKIKKPTPITKTYVVTFNIEVTVDKEDDDTGFAIEQQLRRDLEQMLVALQRPRMAYGDVSDVGALTVEDYDKSGR